MGIRIPFLNIGDKKIRSNFEAIHRARVVSVVQDTQVAVPAGVKATVVIYAVDNGAGKTRLMAQFPTGAPVQLAIEP